MFRSDILKVAGSSLCKSLSPGNQVDDLPGAISNELSSVGRVIPKPSGLPKGKSGQRLSVILGQNFDSLSMFQWFT